MPYARVLRVDGRAFCIIGTALKIVQRARRGLMGSSRSEVGADTARLPGNHSPPQRDAPDHPKAVISDLRHEKG